MLLCALTVGVVVRDFFLHTATNPRDFDYAFKDTHCTAVTSEHLININTAPKEALVHLPGIGETLAERIIDFRLNSPFHNPEELLQVSGIGKHTFQQCKNLIIIATDRE